ncbi:cohesin domain-containing protein [Patescibacteria group bacterium]|nr:cohesin domain-containing protein [Patescibacteria group bacterium]
MTIKYKTRMKKNSLKFKINLSTLILISVFFSVCEAAQAAEVRIDSESQTIGVGAQFEAGVFLNTEDANINAIEGKIAFPEKLLELKEIRDGNSIINFWIERPKTVNGEITFSGIVPGGYLGEKGLIFSAVFQSMQEGSGAVEIRDIKALLNDGEGTSAPLKISNFQFLISKQIPSSQIPISEIKDTDPPELFAPEIASDPNIFGGRYFLVFATQDKVSGIAGYFIHESTRKKEITRINTKEWIAAASPYLLKDQKLQSYIYVKAVDKAGNSRVVMVSPKNPLAWYENYLVYAIITLVALIAILIYTLWRKLCGKYTKNH